MSSDSDENREKLALDLQTIDHFTYLALWGAPWQKAWLDLAKLENRWDGNEIGRMVEERISYPDYAAKVTTPYPQSGWIEDLLRTTNPDFMASQFLCLLIANMADGVSQDMKILMKTMEREEAAQGSKQAVAIYNEAIVAFTNYTPPGLDESDVKLYRSTIDLPTQALKRALAAHLMIHGRDVEAEQSFPGIGKLADASHSKQFMSEQIDKTLSSMAENLQLAGLDPSALTGAGDRDIDHYYPGVETQTDDNPKHLIWCGNEEYLLKNNAEAAKEKWQAAMALVGNFIDAKTGNVNEEQLADCAARFSKTPYTVPSIGTLHQTAWLLLDISAFDLARRYLLLDQAIKTRLDSPHPTSHGFTKATSEMLDHRYMGRALTGLARFEEAEHHLLAAKAIAEKHTTPQDVTGRKVEPIVVAEIELLYWLLLMQADRIVDADKVWEDFERSESSARAIEKLLAERTRIGDFQSPQIVQAKLLSRENRNIP